MSYEYITDKGVIVPDTSTIKTAEEAEWKIIAGEDSTIDSSSFEGRMIDMLTTARIGVARTASNVANQFNPNMATGTFVDAHLALVGSARDGQERSTCECLLSGVVGTIVPAGSFAQDDDRNTWQLVDSATIVAGGVTASFRSVEYGPIAASVGSINKVVTAVTGWETITNEVSATLGKIAQTDISAKRQRIKELGRNSNSVSYSVIAAVSALEGVNGIKFRENNLGTQQVIDGITMQANSSWICVDGGVTSEIVEAYVTNRYGTSFVGDVEFDYTFPESGQEIVVKFDRPTDKPLQCQITVKSTQSQNAEQDVKQAIVDYANGLVDGELGFSLGEDSSPFEIASAVNEQLSGVFVSKCELREIGGTYSANTIENALYEKASITSSDITVILV